MAAIEAHAWVPAFVSGAVLRGLPVGAQACRGRRQEVMMLTILYPIVAITVFAAVLVHDWPLRRVDPWPMVRNAAALAVLWPVVVVMVCGFGVVSILDRSR